MKRALIILLLMVPGIAGAAPPPAVTIMIAPPAEPVTAGREAGIMIFFLNTSIGEQTIEAPERLPCRLRAGERSIDAVMRREGTADAGVVAPGSFVQIRYVLSVPADVAGNVLLEPALPGTAPTALAVASATAPAQAEAPPPAKSDWQHPRSPVTHEAGLVEFVRGFEAHEPIYFVYGAQDPRGKFQISFKYRIFNEDAPLTTAAPALGDIYVGYTQTSFWNLGGTSKPFFDNSFKPEILYLREDPHPRTERLLLRIDFRAGLQHESNGQGDDDSRSLNIAYAQPIFTLGDRDDWFVGIAPRVWCYIGDLDDNPDIANYRGYGELRVIAGEADGIQLAVIARAGKDWDRGSVQLDLSYPIRRLLPGNVDLYLHAQYFTGYGESLLLYDEDESTFRLGLSLVR